jgi:cell division protein FtsB
MAFPVFHEFDADGTIHTNGLHLEGFPHLAWEALIAAGYTTPPTYEVSEFERLGVPRCRVIVTMLPHPDHANWFDLSIVYWGFITQETIESAALRVLMDFCDHDPTVVALSLFGLFPAVSPHDSAWLDRMDHLRELLLLAESLDVTQTLARCLNVVFTLQGLCYNTAAIIGQHLEVARRDWQQLSAAHQQLNFTLTQMQQENDKLRARRFQLELERGDRLQRIVDLEAEVHNLKEDADAHELERLMLLQNIADM